MLDPCLRFVLLEPVCKHVTLRINLLNCIGHVISRDGAVAGQLRRFVAKIIPLFPVNGRLLFFLRFLELFDKILLRPTTARANREENEMKKEINCRYQTRAAYIKQPVFWRRLSSQVLTRNSPPVWLFTCFRYVR